MICLKLGSWLASQKADKNVQLHCRSPHGERGLKCPRTPILVGCWWSLSSWRAWIEIEIIARGISVRGGRSPHGERGLKYSACRYYGHGQQSLSSWRAWIEIYAAQGDYQNAMSLSSWRAWIEMLVTCAFCWMNLSSLSSWRAWIEIVA